MKKCLLCGEKLEWYEGMFTQEHGFCAIVKYKKDEKIRDERRYDKIMND